jgi:hypothetical protein
MVDTCIRMARKATATIGVVRQGHLPAFGPVTVRSFGNWLAWAWWG